MTQVARRPRATSDRVVLRPGFLAWLAAATVSETGDGVLFFALVWTAAGLGAGVATLVMVVGLLPEVFLTLVGGAAADRWGIRRTVVACSLAMCGVLAGILVGSALGAPELLVLVGASVAQGVVSAFHRPANGVLPRLFFDEGALARAMALTGSVLQLARLAGPPVGAVVVASSSFVGAMAVDLVSFVAVIGVLLVVRPPFDPATPADGPTSPSGVRPGLRAVARTPGARALLLAVALLAGGLLPLLGLGVPLLARERGWAATDAGLVEAAWIAGGIGVALVVTRRGTRERALLPLVCGPLLAAVGVVGIGLARGPAVACLAAGVMGVGTAVFTSHVFPLYVLRSPAAMLARFQSVLVTVQMVALLAGGAAMGALVGHAGLGTALAVATAACLLAGWPAVASRTVREARLP